VKSLSVILYMYGKKTRRSLFSIVLMISIIITSTTIAIDQFPNVNHYIAPLVQCAAMIILIIFKFGYYETYFKINVNKKYATFKFRGKCEKIYTFTKVVNDSKLGVFTLTNNDNCKLKIHVNNFIGVNFCKLKEMIEAGENDICGRYSLGLHRTNGISIYIQRHMSAKVWVDFIWVCVVAIALVAFMSWVYILWVV